MQCARVQRCEEVLETVFWEENCFKKNFGTTLVTRNKVSREHRFSKLEDCTYRHPFEFTPPPGVHPEILPRLNILGEAV